MRRIPGFVLLRAFEAAARLESFTLAARELELTPSAISHQVRELEEYFGRALFVRRNRRVDPTLEGRRLFESLTHVFDAMESACGEVALAPREEVLAVHCAPSLAVKWLGPRLPAFARTHPDITIRLSSRPEPVDLAEVREIDVAINCGVVQDRAGVEVTTLGVERFVPLCAPSLLEGDMPPAARISTLTLIEVPLAPVLWRDWCVANRLALPARPRPAFDRAALAISAAVDGMGVVLGNTRLAEREIARGELVELGAGVFHPITRETHFFAQRATDAFTPKVRHFREWLIGQALHDGQAQRAMAPTFHRVAAAP